MAKHISPRDFVPVVVGEVQVPESRRLPGTPHWPVERIYFASLSILRTVDAKERASPK